MKKKKKSASFFSPPPLIKYYKFFSPWKKPTTNFSSLEKSPTKFKNIANKHIELLCLAWNWESIEISQSAWKSHRARQSWRSHRARWSSIRYVIAQLRLCTVSVLWLLISLGVVFLSSNWVRITNPNFVFDFFVFLVYLHFFIDFPMIFVSHFSENWAHHRFPFRARQSWRSHRAQWSSIRYVIAQLRLGTVSVLWLLISLGVVFLSSN